MFKPRFRTSTFVTTHTHTHMYSGSFLAFTYIAASSSPSLLKMHTLYTAMCTVATAAKAAETPPRPKKGLLYTYTYNLDRKEYIDIKKHAARGYGVTHYNTAKSRHIGSQLPPKFVNSYRSARARGWITTTFPTTSRVVDATKLLCSSSMQTRAQLAKQMQGTTTRRRSESRAASSSAASPLLSHERRRTTTTRNTFTSAGSKQLWSSR
ncbi:unnamed protein product [Trichogramma brassicae]|uniref:Uncharacterized protein n=1 Tax=Trichogramma brassicae TaxID=86971 RepID=A0A6H5I7R3_9HYME|nr:unnamed protein product [Trichogramma brassicae]